MGDVPVAYTNKLALAGMLVTAAGRVDGKAVVESTAKKYVGVMSANDVVEKYGFYVAGILGSASSDKTFREFAATKTGDNATGIMTAIQKIIPSAGAADAVTREELEKYASYSGTVLNVAKNVGSVIPGREGATIPAAVTDFNAAIPNQGFAFWDKSNSTFQLYLEYNKPADKITTGIGYLQFLGGMGLRNEQFKIVDNVVQFSKGANVAIIKLIQDLVGVGNLIVDPPAVAGQAPAGPADGADADDDAAAGPGADADDGATMSDEDRAAAIRAAEGAMGGKSTRRKRKGSRKKGGAKKPVSHKKRKSGASKKRRSHPKKK